MSTTLADLRRMNLEEQRQDADNTSAFTEVRESALTDKRTDASTEVITDGRKVTRKHVSKEASTPVSQPVPKEVRASARTDFLTRVRESLEEGRGVPLGGVKATVEMSPELSRRAKLYGLDHKGVSVRQICVALLQEFLTEEGY